MRARDVDAGDTQVRWRHARVVDLFRALDDDANGKISAAEFVKAMEQLGPQLQKIGANDITAVYRSLDLDNSGGVEYKELDRLLRTSIKKHPKLAEVASEPLKGGTKGGTAQASPSPSPPKGSSPSPPKGTPSTAIVPSPPKGNSPSPPKSKSPSPPKAGGRKG